MHGAVGGVARLRVACDPAIHSTIGTHLRLQMSA
jgi:hypothetical protein